MNTHVGNVSTRGTIPQILTRLIKHYLKTGCYSPENINNGACDAFAEDAARLLGGTPIWNDEIDTTFDDFHCFLKLNNRFYDAEAIDGVDNWQDLPFFPKITEKRKRREQTTTPATIASCPQSPG